MCKINCSGGCPDCAPDEHLVEVNSLLRKCITQLQRDRNAIHDEYCGHKGHNGDCQEINTLVEEVNQYLKVQY